MKATGRSMPMILARTQWAAQCPKESNFQFSTFLRDKQSNSRKKKRKAIPGQVLVAISRFPSVHLLDRGVVIDEYYPRLFVYACRAGELLYLHLELKWLTSSELILCSPLTDLFTVLCVSQHILPKKF